MHFERNLFILTHRGVADQLQKVIDQVSGVSETSYQHSKLFGKFLLQASTLSFALLSAFAFAQDTYEDNDTLETSTLLVVGDPVFQAHTLDPDKDVDWFRFNARFLEIYDIEIFDVGSSVDLVLEIYDSKGELIEEIDDFGFGEAETTSIRTLSTGTYYAKVYDYYCIEGGSQGCDQPRGEDAKYSIRIYIPVGRVGGTDLSSTFVAGEPVTGTPFPLGVTVNNGGQQEDVRDNLLILTYSEPLTRASLASGGCEGELGLRICTKEALAVVRIQLRPFEFSEAKQVRFTSRRPSSANYSIQQPDDNIRTTLQKIQLTPSEGSGRRLW